MAKTIDCDGVVAGSGCVGVPVVRVRESEARPHLLVVRGPIHQDL